MNKLLSIVLLSLLIAACTPQTVTPPPAVVANDTNQTGPQTIQITMTADQYSFSPSVIAVKQGDTIIIKATSVDVAHGIALPEFGVNEFLPVGEEKIITFTADKKGTFPFRCSIFCGEGHGRMTGTLTVE